ncbi:MAG: hypothetical protein PUB37_07480 [Firmicutes bacterium]|nr:hypothetical protein [Bacillota bacterium]
MTEHKVQHLEMIQGVINRMAGNSFALKGWAVTLVAGIFTLSSKDADKLYFLVAYIPILVFWGLDAYYLLQERLFRALYNKVRVLDEAKIDYNMDTSLDEFYTGKNSYWCCLISSTECGFYFPLAIVTAGIIIITHI